jgi:hypothetical protein
MKVNVFYWNNFKSMEILQANQDFIHLVVNYLVTLIEVIPNVFMAVAILWYIISGIKR